MPCTDRCRYCFCMVGSKALALALAIHRADFPPLQALPHQQWPGNKSLGPSPRAAQVPGADGPYVMLGGGIIAEKQWCCKVQMHPPSIPPAGKCVSILVKADHFSSFFSFSLAQVKAGMHSAVNKTTGKGEHFLKLQISLQNTQGKQTQFFAIPCSLVPSHPRQEPMSLKIMIFLS